MTTNGETSNGASDGTSNGASDGTSERRGAFAAGVHEPDAFVAIKVRFKNRERFNAWYESQHPGVNMLPARDGWADDVFLLGLEEMERLMPAQLSPAERYAQARAAK
jgi:hypothetical protein